MNFLSILREQKEGYKEIQNGNLVQYLKVNRKNMILISKK
ncbi:hypothetical protein HMP0015_3386 [Acinetobacter haemolyticus ATCC 19194]|uniref:Uncharacterized protein n=1 Tax=Acinetobacter haemolyticus ATCC 19194 TaxID=707232 RepID=D4XUJ4_ACIHA|nr:hypothetical protein HMP0015_3386 [Acinetobacter haemolyticus ATCC 19194]